MSIPAGTYAVRAIKGSEQYGYAKTGTPQVGIDLEFIGGEHEGATATTVLYFSENAKKYAFERLRALGWSGDDVGDLTGIDTNEAQATVTYESFEGKERMKVDIRTGGGGMRFEKTMDAAQRRAFGAQLRGDAAASRPAGAPASRAPAAGGAAQGFGNGGGGGGAPRF